MLPNGVYAAPLSVWPNNGRPWYFNRVWVIEHAITDDDEETHADLVTCQMRGWIEVLHGAIPHSGLNKDGSLPKEGFGQSKTLWGLTSAGWSVIQGTHRLALYATTIATISLLISAISFAINLLQT